MKKTKWECRLSLSQRVLVPLILILLVLTGFRFFDIQRTLKREKQQFRDKLKATETLLEENAERLAKENLKVALTIAAIPGVQESLAFEDRERLLGLIKPLLARLQAASSYTLKIHFHKPPGISFLRVWKPNKYGDDLRSFRKTVVDVLRTGKPIAGIEPGRAGLAVRGVAPIFWEGQDKPIGSVEVFTNLKTVAQRLRRQTQQENALLWMETVRATAATEEAENRIGRFKVLLPSGPNQMALLDEEFLGKALSGAQIMEKGHYLVSAVPVKDYEGKPLGVYVRFVDLTPLKARLQSLLYRNILEIFGFLIVALLIIVLVLRANLNKPLAQALEAAERVARGELDQSVPYGGSCELRDLAASLNRLMASVGRYVLAVQKSVRNLEDISRKMQEAAGDLSSGSDQVKTQSERMLNLSESAAREINQISGAVDQFTVAIQEIVSNINQTSQGIESVKERVGLAREKILSLAESSRRIDEVVKVIDHIAGQTNLLALNATIEAARAGEAGKGFAVVANEVKELAKQTIEATEDIRKTISGIQKEIESSVAAIQEVDDIVSGVTDLATQVAGAAEEQSAVVNDIKNNIDRGSESVQNIAEGMKETIRVLEQFLQIAKRVHELQQNLSAQAQEMLELSAQFRAREEVIREIEEGK